MHRLHKGQFVSLGVLSLQMRTMICRCQLGNICWQFSYLFNCNLGKKGLRSEIILFFKYILLKIGDFHVFSLHFLFEHLVGILEAHYSQSHLVLADSPGVSRFFRGEVIFPPSFPIFSVFFDKVFRPTLFRVVGHVI